MEIKAKTIKESITPGSFKKSVTFTAEVTEEMKTIIVKSHLAKDKKRMEYEHRCAERNLVKVIQNKVSQFFIEQLNENYPAIKRPEEKEEK